MNKILLCDLSESERKEYCAKYDIDIMMATCNCPYPKDMNGITIFPSTNQLDNNVKEQDNKIKLLEETIIKQNKLLEQIINQLSNPIIPTNKSKKVNI